MKVCETGVATAYWLLPACVAWMVHVPTASSVAVLPETEQTERVVEAKLTGSPEEAFALMLNGTAPQVWSGRAAKVMVCVCVEDRPATHPEITEMHITNKRWRTVKTGRRKHKAELIGAKD